VFIYCTATEMFVVQACFVFVENQEATVY